MCRKDKGKWLTEEEGSTDWQLSQAGKGTFIQRTGPQAMVSSITWLKSCLSLEVCLELGSNYSTLNNHTETTTSVRPFGKYICFVFLVFH